MHVALQGVVSLSCHTLGFAASRLIDDDCPLLMMLRLLLLLAATAVAERQIHQEVHASPEH